MIKKSLHKHYQEPVIVSDGARRKEGPHTLNNRKGEFATREGMFVVRVVVNQ